MQSCTRCSCAPRQPPAATQGVCSSRQGSSSSNSNSSSTRKTHHQRHARCQATDPAALQDVIVGGAVTAAVGAALYSGLKQEPVPCDLCAGNGGIKCFACSGAGTGSMDLISTDPDLLEAQAGRKLARGFTSGSSRPGSCRVCKGKGLVLCSKCKGTGYISLN